VYRVEQVFLIQPDSGLLMQHVADDSGALDRAGEVAAMLHVIRDFVGISFRSGTHDSGSLEAMRLGKLCVTIDRGTHALLACVVRGDVTPQFRASVRGILEIIHVRFGHQLESFTGDPETLVPLRPLLVSCLGRQCRPLQRPGERHS
jgi:hypothetical protein